MHITKKTIISFLLVLVSVSMITVTANTATSKNDNVQVLIHLIDYISGDYPSAVRDGKVISKDEYAEMKEFSAKASDLAKQISVSYASDPAFKNVSKLKALIDNKASHSEIAGTAKTIKERIIELTGFKTAPSSWPELSEGQKLYNSNCVLCHGLKGNGKGEAAIGLDPPPANFLNDTLMRRLSPFEAYNTIKLGVEGTAMAGYKKLTDKQIWELAFYIKSLRFQGKETDSATLKQWFNKASEKVSLQETATLSDNEILALLSSSEQQAQEQLTALRTFTPHNEGEGTLVLARNYLNNALHSYSSGDVAASRREALAAYLEGIEPVEAQIKASDPKFIAALEQQMFKVRSVIEKKKTTGEVEQEIQAALTMIGKAGQMMKDAKLTYWLSFLLSASIIMREGLEAFLIIALILALIQSSGAKKALYWLHGGWVVALLMSVAGWFFSDWVISVSGRNREIIEGMVSLLAVLVLGFVGFWLHTHSHAKKWKTFIEQKVKKQLQNKNMLGLAFFSFMVVFREAFESILFLQAINIETASTNRSSIGLGVLAAFVFVAVFVFLFLKYSKKIPVRQLFRYSSWLITLLAVILVGQGIHAIQEAGWFSITQFPITIRVDWLGLYPTLETVTAQILLTGLLLILYYVSNRKLNVSVNRVTTAKK